MDGHAHAEGRTGVPDLRAQRGLDAQRRGHRVANTTEYREDTVAFTLAFDYVPVEVPNAACDDAIVALQSRAHGVRLAFPQARAALDVGQQEGDHTCRECARHVHPLIFDAVSTCLKVWHAACSWRRLL